MNANAWKDNALLTSPSGAESDRLIHFTSQEIRDTCASGYYFDDDIVAVIHLCLVFQSLQHIFDRGTDGGRQAR